MRKAALASALTLLLSLSTAPTLLNGPSPGAAPGITGLGYAPTATDFMYPVGNPRIAPTFAADSPNGYRITQMFDNSCDPALNQGYYYAGIYFCGHSGVDLSDLQEGGNVSAVANGVVVFAGYASSYGEMVRIQHLLPDGTYVYSQYEHMMWGSLRVWQGEVVQMGQVIGLVGSTGFVTGAHLHFEMKSVNEDGPGYSFGNAALLIGYYEPISYVAQHTQVLLPPPTSTPPPPSDTPIITPVVASTAAATSTAPLAPPATAVAAGEAVSATAPTTGSVSGSTDGAGGEHQAVLSDFYSRYTSYVTVTADHLNVRSGSGFEYAPLTSVRKGARLGYLGISGNGWVRVALPSNVTGYVAREWVAGGSLPALPPVVASSVLQPPYVTVLDALYPARNGPMMHDYAIETLRVGERLTYLGTLGSWDKVILPTGREGWVLAWYLKAPAVPVALSAPPAAPQQNTVTTPRTQAAAMPRASGASIVTPRYVVTTVDGLHLRGGPRLGAPLLATLPQGVRLTLHGYATSWAAVTTPQDMQGYVLRFYVRSMYRAHAPDGDATQTQDGASSASTTPGGNTAAQPALSTAAQPASGFQPPFLLVDISSAKYHAANLHAAPNLKARIVLSEPTGMRLALLGVQGDWDRVETRQGAVAWIRQDLVRTP